MRISEKLMSELEAFKRSLDSDTSPVVIGAHSGWLREIADSIEREVSEFTKPPRNNITLSLPALRVPTNGQGS